MKQRQILLSTPKIKNMKKAILFLFVFVSVMVNAQRKTKKKEQAKDTIITEIINVISSYNPTIADAFKIKKNPKINLGNKAEKKKLSYNIFSAPVASTFIPKSGALKGIEVGPTVRLFDNYVAAGYGNFNAPFAEVYLHKVRKFVDEFGVYANYQSSEDGVENAVLNNGFSHIKLGGYYTKEDRYFDWKVGVNAFQKRYNWYGLSSTINYSPNVIAQIEENIKYTLLEAEGEITFDSPIINSLSGKLSSFGDGYNSDEILFSVNSKFTFPLDRIFRSGSDLDLVVQLDYLTGDFNLNYASTSAIDYGFFNLSANPVYQFETGDLKVKLGTKAYLTVDFENKFTDVLFYPDVFITYPLVLNFADLYVGAGGDLQMNSFQSFTDQNPFVSPTLFMTQTNEQYNLFGGLSGKIGTDVSFDIKGSYKSVEDQALFVRNNSKSDGTTSVVNSISLRGFEYGNSFSVLYDDIETISLSAELEMMLSKRFTFGVNGAYYNYTLTNQQRPWNLPEIEGGATMRYKHDKWYVSADAFYVGEREDVLYSGTFISTLAGTQSLDGFIDLNLNVGYHFNPFVSVFVRANNILNSDYERFANFNVQGFQVLGGLTYKFDF